MELELSTFFHAPAPRHVTSCSTLRTAQTVDQGQAQEAAAFAEGLPHTVSSGKSRTRSHSLLIGALLCREWDRIARETNRAQDVVRELRQFGVEMATIAWAKMYEALAGFRLFPTSPADACAAALGTNPASGAKTCATVHLCEAPGAFVAACNHFVRRERPRLEWDWRAITLNPYWEGNDEAAMVTDDALIAQTDSRWSWGEDTSGAAPRPP